MANTPGDTCQQQCFLKTSAKELLLIYSNIPDHEVERHVEHIRTTGLQVKQYPCIQQYRFLALSLSDHPRYEEVLARTSASDILLDVGCGLGQEIRKLVFDGAKATNLQGVDVESRLQELGYSLFRDRATLGAKFWQADMLCSSSKVPLALLGSADIIWASSFFHLFGKSTQLYLATRLTALLKPKPGSMIIGRQLGSRKPGSYNIPDGICSESTFWHSPETWKILWDEVGLYTNTKWAVEAQLDDQELSYSTLPWGHPEMGRLIFTVRLEKTGKCGIEALA